MKGFLNQAHPGCRLAHAWFLEIDLVRKVCMCVYVCLCLAAAVIIDSGRGLRIEVRREN